MARIVLADDGIEFDGESPSKGPLGGVESAIVELTRKLAARGHDVLIRNNCLAERTIDGVSWAPIAKGLPEAADLYIANRGDKLIGAMPGARRTVFWIHNPAQYLLKWRYLSKLWRLRPTIIFIGEYHETTYPRWAPSGGRVVIPYGIGEAFCRSGSAETPAPPKAIFTSNPLRSLDWLLECWEKGIQPFVPQAELHLYSGPGTYGAVGDSKAVEMERVLDKARSLSDRGVMLHAPVPKPELIEIFKDTRVMLYKGDLNETFCAALAEAQASGVPAIVGKYGSVVERVIDGETGTVAETDQEFMEAAVKLLQDDVLWKRQHQTALARQQEWGWDEAAAAFEGLIPA